MSTPDWDGVCACPYADHRHGGSQTRAKHGCHCEACTRAARRYLAGIKATGGYVPTTEVVKHLAALQRRGMRLREVAAAAGVNYSTAASIRAGRQHRAQRATAEALLAVRFKPDPRRPWREARPYALRVRALVAAGWPMAQVAQRAGLSERAVAAIAHDDTAMMRREVAQAIELAYRTLLPRPPAQGTEATKARQYARARGWRGPFDLDESELEG